MYDAEVKFIFFLILGVISTMKMIIIALIWGVLLIRHSTAEAENCDQPEVSFENFCNHFNALRTMGTAAGAPTMKDVIRDLKSISDQLVTNGVLPERYPLTAAQKKCVDPSKYFDQECAYAFYFHITVENPFFLRITRESIREIYVDIWLLHPLLRRCLPHLGKELRGIDAKARLATGLSGENPANFASVLHGRSGQFLREEIQLSCENNVIDHAFCVSLPEMVNLVYAFEKVKSASKTGVKWNAFLLHFVMLKHNNPVEFQQVYPTTTQQVNDLIIKNLEEIFKYFGQGQIEELKAMMTLVPDLKIIKSGCETSWNLPSNVKKNECIFWKAIIQIHAYLKSTTSPVSGKVQKILNTNIDYPAFLSLTEMDRILQVVQNQETALHELTQWLNSELSKTINERFQGLQSYFQKVASFNREKSHADIGYINGRLGKYSKVISSLSTQLGGKLDEILKHAIAAVSLEIAEDTIQVGLAAAVLMNPAEKLFGGSSAGDFMDRAAKLANTITTVGALIQMSKSFNKLVTKTNSISTRFNANANFLETVRGLIDSIEQGTSTVDFETKKQDFLSQYTAYDPQVEKPELAGMVTTWENLIEDSCEVILGTESALAATVKALVRTSGLCPKTKVLAQEMIATYEEIYDFQFELIEAMASYMRSATAMDAASSIATDYEELSRKADEDKGVVDELKILSQVSFISYKINIWQITEAYCDILEYKEGGARPTVCQGVNSVISSLASHVSPVCRNVEANKDVPTESDSDKAFMKLSALYSGKTVTFKIPSSQWLVDNRWINAQDQGSAIVVKKFEVFLPTVSTTERMVRVEAKVIGWNQHTPGKGQKSYVIVPQKSFIFEYLEGHDAQCRKQSDLLKNPYGQSLPEVCPLNVDENNCQEIITKTPLFPSVYSQWQVSIAGYQSVPVPDPDPVADFRIKVGVKLCILQRQNKDKGMKTKDRGKMKIAKNTKTKKKLRMETLCPDGQYWSVNSDACAPCPKGSRSALDGYYCEIIENN